MRRLLLIPVCFFALAVPVVVLANGPRGGFDGIVASIEERYHVHAEPGTLEERFFELLRLPSQDRAPG